MARSAATAAAMTARSAVEAAADAIAAAGCDTPRLDAELLVADALGVDRTSLAADPDQPIPPPAARLLGERVRRRVVREPVAYILGRRGFRHIELAVDARVLIPRPETELLVEIAAERAPRAGRVHDAGTGSGAVALALKQERPDLTVTASDASPAAVELARANAGRLGLDVPVTVARDLPPTVPGGGAARDLDLAAANLPYVRRDEVDGLAPEITRYEPREALVGGRDGLDAIRSLLLSSPPGLVLALEHAPDQGARVRALLLHAETRRDLSGWERVTVGRVA